MKNDYLVRVAVPQVLGVSAFVLAVNFHSPFECLDEISEELSREHVKGLVVFDMLLANGTKLNRFFQVEFDGKYFVESSLRGANEDYRSLSSASAEYLKHSFGMVDHVLLTPAMKFAVERGIPI